MTLRDEIIAKQKQKMMIDSEQEAPASSVSTAEPIEEPSEIPAMPPITPDASVEENELRELQQQRKLKRQAIDAELANTENIGPSMDDIKEQTNRQIWAKPAQAGLSALGTATGADMTANNKAIQGIADAKGAELDQRAKLQETVRKRMLERRGQTGDDVKDFDETETLKDRIQRRLNEAEKLKILNKKTEKADKAGSGMVSEAEIQLLNVMKNKDPRFADTPDLELGITYDELKNSAVHKELAKNLFKPEGIDKAAKITSKDANANGQTIRTYFDAMGNPIKTEVLGTSSAKESFNDKVQKEEKEKTIPGVGVAITPDDVKIVKKGEALRETSNKAIEKLRTAFEKWKNIKVKDIESFKDAYQTKKEIATIREPIMALLRDEANQNLGVLNTQDIPVLERQLPNPATIKAWAEGKIADVDFQKQLDLFQELLNQKVIENQKVRLKSTDAPEKLTPNAVSNKPQSPTSSARPTITQTLPTPEAVIDDSIQEPDEVVSITPEPRVPTSVQSSESMVEMIAPNGKIVKVPKGKVSEAIKKGAKLKGGN